MIIKKPDALTGQHPGSVKNIMPIPADITSGFFTLFRQVKTGHLGLRLHRAGTDQNSDGRPHPTGGMNDAPITRSNHTLNLQVLLFTMLTETFQPWTPYPMIKSGLFGQIFCLILLLSGAQLVCAEETTVSSQPGFRGHWVINDKLSDDTDYQVEVSIRAAGGRPDSGGKRGKGRYKGGPPEQALYDHLSYDEVLDFQYTEPEFQLVYAENFERVFYSDNRKRVVSASGRAESDKQDFAFASWDGDKLLVESRPRDGGSIFETFEILPQTDQLKVTLELKPATFAEPIQIIRIYDRENSANAKNKRRRNN